MASDVPAPQEAEISSEEAECVRSDAVILPQETGADQLTSTNSQFLSESKGLISQRQSGQQLEHKTIRYQIHLNTNWTVTKNLYCSTEGTS